MALRAVMVAAPRVHLSRTELIERQALASALVDGYRLASSLEIMLETSKAVVGTAVEKLNDGAAVVVSWASNFFFKSRSAEPSATHKKGTNDETPYLRGW